MQGVSKRYGRQAALRAVDLVAGGGQVLALLGANGAGKSTLLRVLATLTQPSRGTYRAFGVEAWPRRRDVRSRLGYIGHRPFVYPELTCEENLLFFARMFGIRDERKRCSDALARVGLSDRAERDAASLSRGLLQRLDLARATLHRPSLLVFDEPDTGLDSAGRTLLMSMMREHADSDGLVIFTSHALEFAIVTADRIVTLSNGEITDDRSSNVATVTGLELAINSARAQETTA